MATIKEASSLRAFHSGVHYFENVKGPDKTK